MSTILDTIKALDVVASTNEFHGRVYINLAAARGSRANADLRTKLWVKGDVLTIEGGKGYHSDAYIAAKYALTDAVVAAGGTVRDL